MKIAVFDLTGKKVKDITLDKHVFAEEINHKLMAQAVRVYLANQRKARAKALTRADVDRTRKKLYRQKGTGGARHGDRKSPIFVGGGKALGPNGEQNYTLKLSAKMKMAALRSALGLRASEGNVIALSGLQDIKTPKTKIIVSLLEAVLTKEGLRKVVMVVTKDMHEVIKSGHNITYTAMHLDDTLTTYDVLQAHKLLIAEEALETLTKRLTK
jgi:large subunit ribosomal protein L4